MLRFLGSIPMLTLFLVVLALLLLLPAGVWAQQLGDNTFVVTACPEPTPNLLVVAATLTQDGVVTVPVGGFGAFALAAVNIGGPNTPSACGGLPVFTPSILSTQFVVSADSTAPVSLSLCQTDPASGACLVPPAPTVTTTLAGVATFSVFVLADDVIPFALPGASRVVVRFVEEQTVIKLGTPLNAVLGERASISVAVRTK